MKPAITLNGKPIKHSSLDQAIEAVGSLVEDSTAVMNNEAVTYSRDFAYELVDGELVEVEGDTLPLLDATDKEFMRSLAQTRANQLISAEIKKRLLKNDGRETAEYLNAMRPLFNTEES